MEKQFRQCDYEVWGGIECTLNRINNTFLDQLDFTGHYHREDDIPRLASLGIRRLRYPVLWERFSPRINQRIDWSFATRQLNAMNDQGVTPIVGLVHHGSGPSYTNLTDPQFALKLSQYAEKVAQQFPWIEYYTPVNEPLTTARFSGLYGFWYPHVTNDRVFAEMVLNQVKGIVLSMREIRKVNPAAKLVQTDDLAKTYSGDVLSYQAEFENERRWLTFDLLCGKLDRHHRLWQYFRWLGIPEKELMFFIDNPCPPDIAGFNYYVTSERYLDLNVQNYPEQLWGGNHKHRYVDTEAIRFRHENPSGLTLLLTEAWNRFRIPMATTEAFLSCSEEEQVRWLVDVCQNVESAKRNGVDIRAVTFWALLGEYGWNRLVTSVDGSEYEPGAFDIRSRVPRETLTAQFIRDLALGKESEWSWLGEPGWWKKESRFHMVETCMEK